MQIYEYSYLRDFHPSNTPATFLFSTDNRFAARGALGYSGTITTAGPLIIMPVEKSELSKSDLVGYYISNIFLRGTLGLFQLLPYRMRVPAMGWFISRVLTPVSSIRKRIRANLAHVGMDLTPEEIDQLCREVPDNAGRMIMEYYSTKPFKERTAKAKETGVGMAAFEQARAEGRPVIVITAHFGNYEAVRGYLASKGHGMGALYRRMANPYFNEHYTKQLAAMGKPTFEQGRRGMMELVKHMRKGGVLGILNDLHAVDGAFLPFIGQPAMTSTITAELALKYNALLVPIYGVRQPNGLDFEVEFHDPIPHSDPITMTQAINDDLDGMVRRYPGQWFWIHRRWKAPSDAQITTPE